MSEIIHLQRWEPVKVKPTTEQRIRALVDGSDIRACSWDKGCKIEIIGELSNIPSLKNSKMPGRGFNLDAMIKLKALDRLCSKNYPTIVRMYESVFVLVICASRSRVFDPVNVLETVQDWLEPATKKVGRSKPKARGWGIGLIENDSQVTGLAMHAKQFGGLFPYDVTTIFVLPWEQAGSLVCSLGENVATRRWQTADSLPSFCGGKELHGPETVS